MFHDKTISGRIFDLCNLLLLLLITLITFLPLMHVVMASFATVEELALKPFVLIPTEFSLKAYQYVLSTDTIFRSLGVSVGITVGGTLISMVLTCLMAYGLTRRDMDGRRVMMFMVVFTLLFNGGLIPTFFVVKNMGLIDSYLALILPTAVNAFNLIIMRTFFMNLPDGIEESAKIDGCNDLGILFRIVIPLSMPAIATVSLFYAVNYWNSFFNAIIYLNDPAKWPVQVLLRQIVIVASQFQGDSAGLGDDFVKPPEQTIKMAVIVISTIPILIIYPFLQKYFAKGALVGSVKG
ncbi:carbohydrate ABC transporter permease [Paenibacillus turpanensis]|uniref:carbohydrate ABC transporter permease n=1 Tax=Paenibacillus turpanensis TaxID=2689078 RepID=UPI00140B54DC|nr:carbohydrate ABC transporter permease [Paenibacillus turpanensis]